MTKYLLVSALLVGCGGDGVSDSKKLNDLTTQEAKDLCIESAEEHPPRTVTCEGIMITFGTDKSQCDGSHPMGANCTATVGDARQCQDDIAAATDAELCMGGGADSAACAKVAACSDGG